MKTNIFFLNLFFDIYFESENLNKRRRAVDCDYESSVWLAQILGSVWHVYKDIWSKFLQETISSNIAYYKPSYLEVEVENFDLGDSPVFPQHTRCIDSAGSDIILDMDACLNSKVCIIWLHDKYEDPVFSIHTCSPFFIIMNFVHAVSSFT